MHGFWKLISSRSSVINVSFLAKKGVGQINLGSRMIPWRARGEK